MLSLISPHGLLPQIIERLIPVALFVVIGTMLAPSHGRKVVACLGVLGGVYGMPFHPDYSSPGSVVFYSASFIGALLGSALGMFLAFKCQTRRRIQQPNQPTEPTSPSGVAHL